MFAVTIWAATAMQTKAILTTHQIFARWHDWADSPDARCRSRHGAVLAIYASLMCALYLRRRTFFLRIQEVMRVGRFRTWDTG